MIGYNSRFNLISYRISGILVLSSILSVHPVFPSLLLCESLDMPRGCFCFLSTFPETTIGAVYCVMCTCDSGGRKGTANSLHSDHALGITDVMRSLQLIEPDFEILSTGEGPIPYSSFAEIYIYLEEQRRCATAHTKRDILPYHCTHSSPCSEVEGPLIKQN